jgi:3-isopropylmalate/(R)-2-methylmalate dehydratase large subunit
MSKPATFVDKIWNSHVIAELGDNTYLLHIDRNFQHELAGSTALNGIDKAGRKIRNKELAFTVMDHVLDTHLGRRDETPVPGGINFIRELRQRTHAHNIRLFDIDDPLQGISHIIAPELGISLPGCTYVCGDSHTCTIGGIGALAWGIGSTDVEHVFATQTLIQTKPKNMRVIFKGKLGHEVFAKDMILYLISQVGAAGGIEHAVEFTGSVISNLPVDGRLTICNMAVEFSARTGIIKPDEKVIEYFRGRPFAPKGQMWDEAVEYWRTLYSDAEAQFDKEVIIDCADIKPQVTWGTSPEHSVAIDGRVPNPASLSDIHSRLTMERAISYIGLKPGTPLEDIKIDAVFIGSCTNSRLSDLQEAARILKGRKIAPNMRAVCSPGSYDIKRRAESEGIDKIFLESGFEWRESGCSMCMSGGAGGEGFDPGQHVLSTTNRNFEDRQGRGVRSHLASPVTAAASAITGHITDPRKIGA